MTIVMPEELIKQVIDALEARTKKKFFYCKDENLFGTQADNTTNKTISDISSIFAGLTYDVYDWEIRGKFLLFPYFLCKCHDCTKRRKEMINKGEWIGNTR